MNAHIPHLIEFKNRHQLHGIDTEVFEICNLFNDAVKCARIGDAGRFVFGKAAHMHFINNQILHRNVRRLHVLPIEVRGDNAAAIAAGNRLGSPLGLTGHSACIRIQNDIIRIKQHAARRIVRAVYAVRILKLSNIQAENNHRVDISHPIFLRKWKNSKRFLCPAIKQQQRNTRRAHRRYGKIHTVRQFIGAILQAIALTGVISCNFAHRMLKKAYVRCTESCLRSHLFFIFHLFRMTPFGHTLHLIFRQRIENVPVFHLCYYYCLFYRKCQLYLFINIR